MLRFKVKKITKTTSFIVVLLSTFLFCNLRLNANNYTVGENVCDTLYTVKPLSDLISDVKNIVWTLESYEIAGQAIDLSFYAPFHLVYDDSVFFGDDGCNSYRGIYETNCDSIFPKIIGITLLCDDIDFFSALHLGRHYQYTLQLEDSELAHFHSDSIYTYRSDFLEDVDSLLIDKKWILASNANVTLVFGEDRTFEANYDCKNSNIGCGTIEGIYGIGDDNTILFYNTGNRGSGIQWYHYLKKILSSPSYSVENNLLILFNKSDSTKFEFTYPLSIEDENSKLEIPYNFELYQNYPNPFNVTTKISFQLPEPGFVNLSIYDIGGKLVETLFNEHKSSGFYSIDWNANKCESGIYLYKIESGEFVSVKKCIFVK